MRPLAQGESGQATVEAAFVLPVALLLVLVLVQPGILLYDRVVMQGAAAAACRLYATASDAGNADACEDFVRRRLGAVPEQDNFHVHANGCSWEIEFSQADGGNVTVIIQGEVAPLPLLGAGAQLLGAVNNNGNFVVCVRASASALPRWASSALGGQSAQEMIGAWTTS